jgi:hypothetical protein
LWLKFVSNCRLPVAIWTFDYETGDPGITVADEVVPVSGPGGVGGPLETIPSPISANLVPPGRDTERRFSGPSNQIGTGADGRAAYEPVERPIGYGFGIGTLETVNPGERVLFSVPVEHVSRRWFLRVRFTLVVSPCPRGYEVPYSYVDFSWNKLPDEVRSRSK